ncbi:MAG: calcium/sodium antiporter [Planctomycetaceae bacterium]
MTILMLVVGLVVLTVGAELLVRGASALAVAMKISPLVIGLTVVAFGTSAPELVVSVQSGLSGQGEIAVGNVIGSNIINILFILGISAIITPLVVNQQLVRFEIPLLIALSVGVYLIGMDGVYGRVDGLLLFAGLLIYTVWGILQSRRENLQIELEYAQELVGKPQTPAQIIVNVLLLGGGLGMMIFGSKWFAAAAVEIARAMGVSELVIGLTIVALGTSLPEVATSIVAALKGERDIAVGNVIGSNLFNIMCVLGVSSAVTPGGLPVPPEAMHVDIPVMILAAIACLPICLAGHQISRSEGGLLLAGYITYNTWLVLSAKQSPYADQLGWYLLRAGVPLAVLFLIVNFVRSGRSSSSVGDNASNNED